MFSLSITFLIASFSYSTVHGVSPSCELLRNVFLGIDAEGQLASSWRNEHVGSFIETSLDLSVEENEAVRNAIVALLEVNQLIVAMENATSRSNGTLYHTLHAIFEQLKEDICAYLTIVLSDDLHYFVCTDERMDELLMQLKLLEIILSAKSGLISYDWQCLVPAVVTDEFRCSYWNDFAFNGTCSNGLVSPHLESATRYIKKENSKLTTCSYCDPPVQA